MPTCTATIQALKDSGEDFEWYPTTNEIIETVARSIAAKCQRGYATLKVLDIGAGDGRVLAKLQDLLRDEQYHYNSITVEPYAIERAATHLANMPKRVVVIGTEFHEQALVDKEVDVVFCNPPYSEYGKWMLRILRECAAEYVYMVVPRRWRENSQLSGLLDELAIEETSLGEFDFENADRRARVVVEVVRFDMGLRKGHAAFDTAIEAMLPELARFDAAEIEDDAEPRAWGAELAAGGNLIDSLVAAYDAELAELYETYRSVVQINPRLLKELGVTKPNILEGLRSKIRGLKNKYWKVLFEHLDDVTKRFATKQRRAFLDSLQDKTVIDFTGGNIRSMLIWIAKWSSDFFEEQLVELFRSLAQHANVRNYKSNEKVFRKDRWRYMDERDTHYKVDYRLVIEGYGGINSSQWSYEAKNGLMNRSHEFLSDFITIANNLGFACSDRSDRHEWESRKKIDLLLDDGTILMDVRAFMNGNLHIRVAKRVMLAINVQAGKLLGWIHSAEQAVRELEPDQEDVDFVAEAFNKSHRIEPSRLLRLGHVA